MQKQQEGREEAKFDHVEIDITEQLWHQLNCSLESFLVSENHFNEYFFTGGLKHPEKSYSYLHPENFEALKPLLPKINIVQGEIESHINGKAKRVLFKSQSIGYFRIHDRGKR